MIRFGPPRGSEYVSVGAEDVDRAHHAVVIRADFHVAGDEEAIDDYATGRRNFVLKALHGGKQAQAFADAGLEEGHVPRGGAGDGGVCVVGSFLVGEFLT